MQSKAEATRITRIITNAGGTAGPGFGWHGQPARAAGLPAQRNDTNLSAITSG